MSEKTTYKIILIGDSAVGKTCIFKKITTGVFNEKSISTIGMDRRTLNFTIKDSEGRDLDVEVQLWDTAGQERFRTITNNYYKSSQGLLLIYDITKKDTFNNVENWINNIKETLGEEFLLTCDDNKLFIVWDIQNNYNKKYTLKVKYFGNVFDAILTFNILGKDCIIVSSGNANEYTKIYELKERPEFIKNVYGTNKNNTNYLIPWEHRNKKYIIELCDKKITVNNLLDDDIYANLAKDPEGYHLSGYLYNDNYLCVSDARNNFVRIWDLVNKTVYKEISFEASNAYEIIQWNKNCAIVGCKSCFVVVHIDEGKMLKKVMLDNTNNYLRGIKRIKMIQLGECLIGSDDNNNIRLFSV